MDITIDNLIRIGDSLELNIERLVYHMDTDSIDSLNTQQRDTLILAAIYSKHPFIIEAFETIEGQGLASLFRLGKINEKTMLGYIHPEENKYMLAIHDGMLEDEFDRTHRIGKFNMKREKQIFEAREIAHTSQQFSTC